jgi:hypothetical protein
MAIIITGIAAITAVKRTLRQLHMRLLLFIAAASF